MGQFGLPRGWGFTRPMLNKAQVPLEVSQVHFKKGVEKGLKAFAFGSTPFILSRKDKSCWSLSNLLIALENVEASYPCALKSSFSEAMTKPVADKAILDKALRFQGMLSWTQFSWGERPSSSTPFWVVKNSDQGGNHRETMGNELGGKGFSKLGGKVSENVSHAVKGPLPMVFHDSSAAIFP